MSHEAPQHDRELEPSDDTIAALQHAVAEARARGLWADPSSPFRPESARRQVLAALSSLSGPRYNPTANEWLAVARLAVQAYEHERAREQGL